MFGHGAGCDFINESCLDSFGNIPTAMEGAFCNSPIQLGSGNKIDPTSSSDQMCDPSYTHKTYCDLVDVQYLNSVPQAPEKFRYVESQPFYRPFVFTSADYCPIPHLDPQSCAKYGGRTLSDEQLKAGEYYGTDSQCVKTDGSRSYSLCLQTICNARLGQVQIMAGGEKIKCEYDGQTHTVLFDNSAGPLRIKCPRAALVCPQLFCPSNCAGRGDCIYRSKETSKNYEPLVKCVCDSEEDTSDGCYGTELTFPSAYGYEYVNPNRANKTLFMVITGSLVAGLAVMYCVVRQWKAKQNVFM